jgi:hypothetical protein
MPSKLNAELLKKDKKRVYAYKQIKDCNVGDQVNFYAVVVDATSPHQSFKSKKQLCTLKLADPSSRVDKDGVVEFISIVFFADKIEDLPVCQRIGDIIRVHRATVSTYRDRRQLTANVCFNSSWALFPPTFNKETKLSLADEFSPTLFFGKSCQI